MLGFFAIFSSTMSKSPILPLFAESLITNPTDLQYMGYVISASTIPGIIISFLAGRLSDMYGRRILLLISSILFASAPFLYLLAFNLWILMLVRFYHGFATGIFVPVATAAISERFPKERGKYISLFSSITLVGRFFAPLTGGLLLFITSYYFHGVYIACGLLGIVALIMAIVIYKFQLKSTNEIEKVSEHEEQKIHLFKGLKELIKNKDIMLTSLVQASQYFAYGIVEAYIVLYAQALNFQAWIIGLIPSTLIFTMIIFKPIMGTLSDKIGRRIVISVGLLIGGTSLLFLPFFANVISFILVTCGFGLGMSMVISSTAAHVSDLSKKDEYGAAIGILSTIMDIGQTIGPIISGYILVMFSHGGVFLMTGIVLIATGALFSSFNLKPELKDNK